MQFPIRIPVASLALAAAALGVLALFATTAFAGVGLSVAPNFPSSVTVGQNNVAVSMDITNNSTTGDGNPLTLNSIKLVPSCGAISGGACTSNDPSVFAVGAAGTGAGACAANTFTIAVSNASSGEVTFTPNSAIALTPGQTCTINFTVNVVGSPTVDATGAAGVQTLQLGNVSGLDQLQQPGTGTGSDTTTVNKTSPSISTTPSAGGNVGTVINDTATLSGGFSPTGAVTFKLFAANDASCAGAPIYTDADASAPYATSPGYTSTAPGTYHWTADYAGDSNNNATSSPCSAETVTIAKATPTISTTPSAGGTLGVVLNDTATLSGGSSPTGSVTFTLFAPSDAACAGPAVYTDTDASAPFATSPGYTSIATGTYRWMAVYSGDANNNAATSTCAQEPVVVTTPTGHLIVDKVTNPSGDPTSFTFNTTGAGYSGFSLTDAAAPNNQVLNAGTYTISEASTTGWTLTSVTCSTNGGAPVTYAPGSSLTLNGGDTISCTFTNTKNAVQYCSPGYWKQPQHLDSWASYSPSQTFSSVFGRTITIMWSSGGKPSSVTNPTLLQALQANGGGISMLARVAVDGLLNASALSSGLTPAQAISIVQHAIDTNDYQGAATQLTAPENCPLN